MGTDVDRDGAVWDLSVAESVHSEQIQRVLEMVDHINRGQVILREIETVAFGALDQWITVIDERVAGDDIFYEFCAIPR